MSTPDLESRASIPPLVQFLVAFLDPRRWLGTLLALIGVFLSIVTAVLPTSLIRRVSQPPTGALPPHRLIAPPQKRPLPVPTQPSSDHTGSATRRPARRPRTAGDLPISPHVTFTHGPPPPTFSTGSILVSSPSNSSVDHSAPLEVSSPPTQSDIEAISQTLALDPDPVLQSIAIPSLQHTLPSSLTSTFNHPVAIQSLESLDLATLELSLPSAHRPLLPNSRRSFRLPLPKLGLGKRRSITDLKTANDSAAEATSRTSKEDKRKEKVVLEGGWEGNETFAVKRRNTTTADSSSNPPMPRRKFTIFNREGHSGKEKGKDKDPLPPSQSSSTGEVPPVPALPSPATLERMVATLPPHPPVPPPASSQSTPSSPLSPPFPTVTPPPRPARTDPYKTYGVPVPGSERALAFLKAEKEMRTEREKRMRVEQNEKDDVQIGGSGRTDAEPTDLVVEQPAMTEALGIGVKVQPEGREESETRDKMDEFGVLSSIPAAQTTRSHLRSLSWGLSRRSIESSVAAEREARKKRGKQDKRSKDEDKDPPSKVRGLSKTAKTRGKKDSAKERGYVSDTGVPSLTFKLM